MLSAQLTVDVFAVVLSQDILDRFEIGLNTTRVAVITFGTVATIDINGIRDHVASSADRCSLYRRLGELLEMTVPDGHSATGEALRRAYDVLLESRPGIKKAVLLVTDGR